MSKKIALPGCDNCADTACPLKSCARCMLVKYCGKPCQRQHWKSGHKKRCVSLADRKPFAVVEDVSVLKCVICLDAIHEGKVCLQDTTDYFEKHANVKIKCGHQFHYKCALEAARESTACVICRADIKAGERVDCIVYKLFLMEERFFTSDVELAGLLSFYKNETFELASVVEKEVLEIEYGKQSEAYTNTYFLYSVFMLHGMKLSEYLNNSRK